MKLSHKLAKLCTFLYVPNPLDKHVHNEVEKIYIKWVYIWSCDKLLKAQPPWSVFEGLGSACDSAPVRQNDISDVIWSYLCHLSLYHGHLHHQHGHI